MLVRQRPAPEGTGSPLRLPRDATRRPRRLCHLGRQPLVAPSQYSHRKRPTARPCAAALSDAALRQAILPLLQGQDLSRLSVIAARHALEEHLGYGRDGLIARRNKIGDLAREMGEQPQSSGQGVVDRLPVALLAMVGSYILS